MNKTISQIFIYVFLVALCSCKSKTELYLERGLDILSNKEFVDFNLHTDILVKEIGVIRDQKEAKKTMVFKLDPSSRTDAIQDVGFVGLRVWIIDDNGDRRIEDWDFKPKIETVKNFKYILRTINMEEDQIKRMKLYMYTLNNKRKVKHGDELVLHKINTYND